MATLVSPGVSVTIIDDSLTPGQGDGTVPFILVATAENKQRSDGDGIAEGTLKENSEDLYLVTSQRELVQTFGDPRFASVGSTQMHASPLSEYGLLAAHSYLGIANRAYILRADIDLAQLEPTTIEPTNPVAEGTYWFDTDDSLFGLHTLTLDPDDSSEVIWSPVNIDVVFIGGSDDSVGQDGNLGIRVDEIGGNESMEFIIRESGSWVALHEADNSAYDLISARVYPSTSSYSPSDVGKAYWFKTADSQNGTEIALRVMTEVSQFEDLDVVVANDDSSAESLISSLSDGTIYVESSFSQGSSSHLSLKIYDGSDWNYFSDFISSDVVPTEGPSEGNYWYNADVGLNGDGESTVDLLVNTGTGEWINVNLPGISSGDMNGDVDSSTLYAQSLDPREQSTITLSAGDLWLDTADLDNYPSLHRFKSGRWVSVDLSDQTTPNGIIFADARPSPIDAIDGSSGGNGLNNGGGTGPNLDIDAPDPDAYPAGMLLWNTRYSTRNVKQWESSRVIYVDGNDVEQLAGRWVSVSGNRDNGMAYFGQDAQKQVIVQKMASAIASNEDIRAETTRYNLIAAPGFPELIDDMTSLNVDIKETAFVIGDTPFNLRATGTDLNRWGANLNNATSNGDDGLVSSSPYLGVYYPSGMTTNTNGASVVVPSSHMVLRTIAYNDSVSYPWFSPAGIRRGVVSNATSVGYVNDNGEFNPVVLGQGLRDVLSTNNINPITPLPNSGVVVYGQKTRSPLASALDRVNVARLTNYIRRRCDDISRPFLFEQNDKQTRDSIKAVFDSFFSELISLRGLEDFIVVCDESNNTPDRRDRNELWVDVAIIPLKSAEFIYVPIRIQNSGTL